MKTKPNARLPAARSRPPSAHLEEEELRGREEQDEQQVADHHVHEEPERERHGPMMNVEMSSIGVTMM